MKKLILALIFSTIVFGITTTIILLEKNLPESDSSINFQLFSSIEKSLLDLRFYFREENFESQKLNDYIENNPFITKEAIIVGIDQDSLLEIGEWPWYRYVYNDFLHKIRNFSPLSLHLDIIFNIPEEAPQFLEKKIAKSKLKDSFNIQNYYSEMDLLFIKELKKTDNIFVDQFLMKSKLHRFDENFMKRLRLNEKILKQYSIPFSGNSELIDTPYVFTEPLITGVMKNAIPAVVNAEADSDQVLRNATLLYPYLTQDLEKKLLPSIYILLLLNYYNVSKDNVIAYKDKVVIKDAMAPILDQTYKNPIEKELELSKLDEILTKKNIQKKYNKNLYKYIVGIYESRFQNDSLKVPEFPIHLLENNDGTYTLISGLEILNAAKYLRSKLVKVIIRKRKNIIIPTFPNQDRNPFNFFINYASRQIVQGIDSNTGQNFSKFMLPKQSFKDVYLKPYLPSIPRFSKNKKVLGKRIANNQDINTWFIDYVNQKVKQLQTKVYRKYLLVNPENMLLFSINENHFEGFFYLIHLYLQKHQSLKKIELYQQFITKLFKQNNIPLDHPLITDFQFTERVIYDALLDAYGEGYKTYYNKTVFVGSLTTGMALDVHKTTYGDMFGINTIFNAFSTIIKENQLDKFSLNQELIMLLVFCLLIGIVYIYLPVFSKYFFIIISTIIVIVISQIFFYQGYIITTFPFIFANLTIFGIIILYAVLLEERDKKFLQLSFSDYLSPELIDEMYQKKQRPQLGGEEKEITAYFTDIQGFSSFSEILTATQLVELLNEYLGKMTDILLHEKGTLDKYEGDAIIAFFGAPAYLGDNALRACRTALIMQKELEILKEKWRKETSNENRNLKNSPIDKWSKKSKWPFLVHDMRMRIGINTGDIVVGNMGSEKRKNYTMMGDSVNLAARLESLAKQYGIYTILSEYTLNTTNKNDSEERLTQEFISYRNLDRVSVVGKEEPINIYELLSLKDEESEQIINLKKSYETGMEHYFNQQWDQAIDNFTLSQTFEFESNKNPSIIMIKRCQDYKKNPPVAKGETWDGVFKASEK